MPKPKPKQKNILPKEVPADIPNLPCVVEDDDPATEAERKGYYFDNHKVEQLLIKYVKDGCVNVKLRDEIMGHAAELIRQIIRTHNFQNIYPGSDEASFNDLFQVAWVQIESTLYKFDSSPGHTKVFNMWSQVAKTVMLAHIKRETRDKKNYHSYKSHLDTKSIKRSILIDRFINEAREICKYNKEHLGILNALRKLYDVDDKPHEGLIGKVVTISGVSRSKVSCFLRQIRLRSFEFTDAPVSEEQEHKENKSSKTHGQLEEEDYDG
jgi:hypothetical protein